MGLLTDPSPSTSPGGDLYLIDTMGYIFRAFHALPPLSNSRGQPTQAVLGFINMLRKLLAEAHPAQIAAVFDLAGPTFRDTRFAGYKATRAPMPETLGPQLPYIRQALEAFRVPILQSEGFEADDVIGTVALQAAAAGAAVVVVSSDKDLLQLVNGGVRVYNPSRDAWLDAAAVEAKLGVKPEQVADLLALRGDSVDNIPGAPGIGEKGAQMLIARFGSVEQALEHAAEVESKRYRESLQNFREQILLSKELATIHTGVPIAYTPGAWLRQEPDREACRALYTDLEFHHLLRGLGDGVDAAPAAVAAAATPAAGAAELEQFLAATAEEPVALAWGDPHAAPEMGLAAARGAWRFGSGEFPQLPPSLAAALAHPERRWQFEDAKAARARLRELALPVPGLDPDRIDDVLLLGYVADPTRGSYEVAVPAGADAGAVAAAVAVQAARLHASVGASAAYRELDLPLIAVLEDMEAHGIRVDPAPLTQLSKDLERRGLECQEQVFALAGERFNLSSPQQLAAVLFDRLGLPAPARRGKSKSRSTAVDVLEDLAGHEIIPPILEFRQLSKLKATYVDALPQAIDPATGRVHTTFTIAGAATGRLSSSNPNLQNIPVRTELGREIRAAFVAEPGYCLLAADYSQIELRLLAHFSQDALLLAAYRGNDDIHRLTAAEVFGVPPMLITGEHRRRAKAVNFGIVYGLSAFGLARQLGIPQAEAAKFIQRYFERYAGVRTYLDRTLEQARKTGSVATLFGRTRPIPNLDARNPALRGFAERTAVNTPLQGTAADLIKLAMIRLHPRLAPLGARLLLQVHDELVLEVPEAAVAPAAALVREVMEGVAKLDVPLRVELGVGENWRDLEELN
jgi:DNA polymerase-1